MQSDNSEYFYSDFGRIPWVKIPEQYHSAKTDKHVHGLLVEWIWQVVKNPKNDGIRETLGLPKVF